MSKLIRAVQGGKLVREIRLDALLGKFFDRIEKAHGTVEISDPDLEMKLDESELKQLYAKFPELNPNRPLPPKPSTEPISFRSEPKVEKVIEPKVSDEAKAVTIDEPFDDMTDEELVKYLTENGIKFDKRKKNNTEYLIKTATEK